MSLPAYLQQILDRIEQSLYACDPGLRSKFAIFTKLPSLGIVVQCLSVCTVTTSDQTRRPLGTE